MTTRTDVHGTPRPSTTDVHVILVPGYWLGGWAWTDVEPGLSAAGIKPHAVTLPGLDGSSTAGITLTDHVDAVVELVGHLDGRVVLVGHSGGGLVVQGVADRMPQRIDRVIYVDSGPLLEGVSLSPDVVDDVELPSWDELVAADTSIDGIDDEGLATFRDRAVPHPVGVATSAVRLTDDARLDVPVTVVCTSLPADVLRSMIGGGHMPSELPSVHDVRYVDLPTGHWPMFSRPTDLAAVLVDEIGTTAR